MTNQTFGIRVNQEAQRRAFDRLPPPIRRVIDVAPFKYAITGIEREFKAHLAAGGTVREYRQVLIERLCDDLMREAARVYGPDRPDATVSRLTRRP